jgi:serine beta-lactamase-like protein LACTB, mitochondrial
LTDLENNVQATNQAVYRIASVSKPITAVAVMQLVKKGKIDLDAPIQKYVPEFPKHSAPITVRQLLTHTSGIRHYKDDAEFNTTKHCKDLSEGTSFFLNDSLVHKPGEKITYSTYGFVLLGLAVEKASGMRFTDYLREHIFAPAGMASTREDLIYDIVHKRARGYAIEKATEDLKNPDLVDTSCRIPAGGLLSTAGDLARFLIALNSGLILDAQSRSAMFRNYVTEEQIRNTIAGQQVPPNYQFPGFGLGWAIHSPGRRDALWHGGNQQGATSMLYWVPAANLGLAMLTNLGEQGGAVTTLAEQIAKTMIGD